MAKKSKSKASTTPKAPSPTTSSTTTTTNSLATPSTTSPTYFEHFPTFTPRADTSFLEQFNRLAISQGWTAHEKHRRRGEAIQQEFDYLYGADTSKLEAWQGLCAEVGVEGTFGSVTQCRKALKSRKVMVNLVNLIDHRRRGVPLKMFNNFAEFQAYTRKNPFPKKKAKAEGFIKALLRVVF